MKNIMPRFLIVVTILCTLFQEGYLQENYIYAPNSLTGQHGKYPYWPFQVQTMNGNYNPNPRRYKKPCTRRANANDPNSEDEGSQWILTYSATVKPLEQNNLLFKSRSLKDQDFDPKTTVAPDKVVELNDAPEVILSRNVNNKPENSVSANNNPCVTSTATTEEVVSKKHSDKEEIPQTNENVGNVVEDNNGPTEYDYESRTVESSEEDSEDCNNKIEIKGNSRRSMTHNDDQSDGVLKSNKVETMKHPKIVQNTNPVVPHPQVFKDPLSSEIDEIGRVAATMSRPNGVDNSLIDPTKARGISHMGDDNVMLMRNTKVCYACSSVSDPTCWNPDRRTTVKYCRVGHDSCVTKTVQNSNSLIVIRDCASSCDDNNIGGLISHYKSCSICHYDLCNSAYSNKVYNFMLLFSFFALIKYSF